MYMHTYNYISDIYVKNTFGPQSATPRRTVTTPKNFFFDMGFLID
jgi:hypothetical protein